MNKGNPQDDTKNNVKIIFLIFIIILFLGFISYHRIREFEEIVKEIEMPEFPEIPELKLPVHPGQEFEMPDIEHFFPGQEFEMPKQEILEEQEFISPDNTLRLEYSPKWQRKDEVVLEIIDQELRQEIEKKMEILFFAQRTDLRRMKFSYLIIQKLRFEKEPTIEDVIEKIKEITEKEGIEIEIIELEIEDNQARFTAEYQRGELGHIRHANTKEKILLIDNRAYWITILIEQDWPEIKEEAEKILNSAQLI